MKSVALITGSEKLCGIHHYADAVCSILSKSKKHNFYLLECDSEEEFNKKCNADIVIMNYQPRTLSWYTPEVSNRIKQIQFLIDSHAAVEQVVYDKLTNIKEIISMDVTRRPERNHHPGVRPVIFYDDLVYSPPAPNRRLRIGTSGVGSNHKHLEFMAEVIKNQFVDPISWNIHFSLGTFTGVDKEQMKTMHSQLSKILTPNIELNFICEQFSHYELIKWLNQNDINIYIYNDWPSNAVSASIDNALAARKPIGINNANFFRHIYSTDNSLEVTSIKEIINKGVKPLEKFYDIWNQQKLLEQYETLVDRYDQ